ncbi:hypothetical protein B0A48_01615 [Cryoendolithus antarcticus]|uniref:Apple domain-containing protein n=1 Tax=Cryoendolithus antarcticus TaxID=1507870 RepID=A0A1V8TPT1_9PEZI|nr:hypothetical protein B0A48_01615 [Cryoendolithus antarcticus]
MRSVANLAVCLSLVCTALARVPPSVQKRNDKIEAQAGVLNWMRSLLHRETCYEDDYYYFVNNSTFGETICQALITYPNETTTYDYTPTQTATVVTTHVYTDKEIVRTTATSTVTVTVSNTAMKKRAPLPTPAARITDLTKRQIFDMYRRAAADNSSSTPSDNEVSTSLSSACECQTYSGSTVTRTYTNLPVYSTLYGFTETTTTVYSTRTDGPVTTTTTTTVAVTPSAAISPSENATSATGSAAASSVYAQTPDISQTGTISDETSTSFTSTHAATPTAKPFTCPDDNNNTVSQMVDNERFDYDIYCNADLPNSPDLFSNLSYDRFSQCVAACSLADAQFDQPVCQGVVYYEVPTEKGANCFLKAEAAANETVLALGMDVAILRRIAVGVAPDDPSGTSIESVPFNGETSTVAPTDMSSSMSSMFGNSTTSVPIITPGPPVASGRMPAYTSYSTYVQDGTTYSTGSIHSTYYSSNGSWYYSYYTTWSVAWSSATTVYAAGETQYAVGSNNTSNSQSNNSGNGGYSTIQDQNVTEITYRGNQTVYNTTETIIDADYSANGTHLNASTTTLYYSETSYYASNSNGDSGSDNGGNGGASSGVVTSTGVIATQTVIYNSGATSGGSGYATSGVVQTPPPVITSTSIYSTENVITNSGGTAGGSGYAASGYAYSTGSGQVGSVVIINSYGTAYSSSYATSGANSANGTGDDYGGDFSTAASGVITSTGPANTATFTNSGAPRSGTDSSDIVSTVVSYYTIGSSVIVNSYATAYGSGYVASGVVTSTATLNGTSGGYGTAASGAITTSKGPFTNSPAPRSGTESSDIVIMTGPAPYPPYTIVTSSEASGAASSSANWSFTSTTSTPAPYISNPVTPPSYIPSGTAPVPYLPYNHTVPPPLSATPSSAVLTILASTRFSNSGQPRSGTDSSSTPSATLPIAYPPFSHSPSLSTAPMTTYTASRSILPSVSNSTVAIPLSTGPSSSLSSSQALRTGTESTDITTSMMLSTGTSPPQTSITPIFSSCMWENSSYITVTTTETIFGCYSNCLPQNGYGGGPQSLGPPAFWSPYTTIEAKATTTAT